MNKNDSFKVCITRDCTQPANPESLLFRLSWKVLQLLLKEEGSSDSSQRGYACITKPCGEGKELYIQKLSATENRHSWPVVLEDCLQCFDLEKR